MVHILAGPFMIVSGNKSISNQLPCWINSGPARQIVETIPRHICVESLHEDFPNRIAASAVASLNPMKSQCGVSSKLVTDGVSILIHAHGLSMFSATFAMVTFDTLAVLSATKIVR